MFAPHVLDLVIIDNLNPAPSCPPHHALNPLTFCSRTHQSRAASASRASLNVTAAIPNAIMIRPEYLRRRSSKGARLRARCIRVQGITLLEAYVYVDRHKAFSQLLHRCLETVMSWVASPSANKGPE